MLPFLGIIMAASVVWLVIGAIISGYYENKIGFLEAKIKDITITHEERLKQAERMLIYARRVIDNRWFFNNGQATQWFVNYCDRYDPARK